jgi:hypothetical protein
MAAGRAYGFARRMASRMDDMNCGQCLTYGAALFQYLPCLSTAFQRLVQTVTTFKAPTNSMRTFEMAVPSPPNRHSRSVKRTQGTTGHKAGPPHQTKAKASRRMNDTNREEVKARLEASEARVASALDGIRADTAVLRSDISAGLAKIQAQGEQMKADAGTFYAEARTVLTEIRLAQEQAKSSAYAIGYKVIVWSVSTVLALAGLALGGYNALKRPSSSHSLTAPPTSGRPAPDIEKPRL